MHSHSELKTLLGLWSKGKNAMINDVEKIKSASKQVLFPIFLLMTCDHITNIDKAKIMQRYSDYFEVTILSHQSSIIFLSLYSYPLYLIFTEVVRQSSNENLVRRIWDNSWYNTWDMNCGRFCKKRTIFSLIAIAGF